MRRELVPFGITGDRIPMLGSLDAAEALFRFNTALALDLLRLGMCAPFPGLGPEFERPATGPYASGTCSRGSRLIRTLTPRRQPVRPAPECGSSRPRVRGG